MFLQTRFGRRIALPSTRQIIHELRVMADADKRALAPEPAAADVPAPTAPALPKS